jgi:hypothetical protein
MPPQLEVEPVEVDAPVGVLADRDDVGDRLAPWQLVRVVLVRADEHDRAFARVEREQADELVDRSGRAGAAEQHHVVLAAPHGAMDDASGVLAQRGGVKARGRSLRVRVRVQRQHALADEVLDEGERAARGRVVGVHQPARPERPVEHRIVADHGAADPLDQLLGGDAPGSRHQRRLPWATSRASSLRQRMLSLR